MQSGSAVVGSSAPGAYSDETAGAEEQTMGKLQDKIAIITGAASGIGQACAELFAREGAKVVVADIQDEAGELVAKEVGGRYRHVDVTDPAQVEGMIKGTVDEFGRVDILVNNAGIEGEPGIIGDSSIENWKRVMSINMDAVYYGMKYVLPVMVEQKGGVILNTASTVGTNAIPGLPAYGTSKAGVVQLSKAAAIEYAYHHIRVNAICPSVVDTPLVRSLIAKTANPEAALAGFGMMNPLPGMITLDAVAKAALFLVSDDSSCITAVALPVDGGYTAR
jgi:NAD(P)-dependent dehydrogenase (short-subunit alcohol dehydrogenase family)